MVGLAQYSYAGARFTAIIVAACVLVLAVRDRLCGRPLQVGGALSLLGAALLTAAPMIQHALRFPLEYNARLNHVGIVQSGWLAAEAIKRHQPAWQILLDQLQRAALAFNVYPDRTMWYGSPRPLFDFVPAVLFLLGLGYATLRLADVRLFPLVAWWWGAMFLGGALTESPPSSQRLVTLAVPAAFFVALALYRGAQLLFRASGAGTSGAWPCPSCSPSSCSAWRACAGTSWSTPRPCSTGTPTRWSPRALGHYARDRLGPDWRIYLFGAPRLYAGFGSIPYLARGVEGTDVTAPLTGPPAPTIVRPDKHAAFVFLPERQRELDLVRQTFPGGELETVPSPLGGDPLYLIYRVPRPLLARPAG